MSSTPRIKTTVVGSYPIPDWLAAAPSEQALLDATRVVIDPRSRRGSTSSRRRALSFRREPSRDQRDIEYFVHPLDGVRTRMSFEEQFAFRSKHAVRFRMRPPGVVEGPIGAGTLALPDACARAKALASHPFKFTLTGPHMLAKTLVDRHYGSTAELAMAIADVLAAQVRHLDADVVQVDEANLPGAPDEWNWAAAAMNRVLDAVQSTPAVHLCFGNYGGQSPQKGTWAKLMNYLNALHVDHVVLECAHRPAEELAVFKALRPDIGMGLGVVDIKRTEIEAGGPDRAGDRGGRAHDRPGPRAVHPPGLRFLDA